MLSVSVKVQSEGHATRRTYFYLSIYLSHLSFICPICHLSIHPYIYLSSIIYLPIYPLIIYLSTHPSNQSILSYLIYLLSSIYYLSPIHPSSIIYLIYLSSIIYLSICLSIYLHYLSMSPSTYLSVCLRVCSGALTFQNHGRWLHMTFKTASFASDAGTRHLQGRPGGKEDGCKNGGEREQEHELRPMKTDQNCL
jgi:hypothetical protein